MTKLIVDADGKLVIPSDTVSHCGWRPGDELIAIERGDTVVLQPAGELTEINTQIRAWYANLSEVERQQVDAEAQNYEAMTEAERDAFWNESLRHAFEEAETDERDATGDVPSRQRRD
jgi:bifunctional DNA-binding transcriptional regulator/antitoxin component of YhaV-PrlF toxin-antitoxin module